MSSVWIKYENVSKSYKSRTSKKKTVFSNIDISIHEGETLGIFGPSGCGKSTLLRMLLGLTNFDEGNIYYKEKLLTKMTHSEKKEFHKKIQVVFQDPRNAFNPRWRLIQSLMEPLKIFSLEKNFREEKIKDFLTLIGLEEGLLKRYPHQLSGGQLQRLALVRCLLVSPEGLFLDEASSMLDVSVQANMMRLLKEIQSKNNMTMVLISHDWDLVKSVCDRAYSFEETGLTIHRF